MEKGKKGSLLTLGWLDLDEVDAEPEGGDGKEGQRDMWGQWGRLEIEGIREGYMIH